jgi:predicted dinucleotide-binding enzyme
MKVAIIGAGNVGKALATSAARAGHEVIMSARTPEHAHDAAQATGAQVAEDNGAAARAADLVILAVPYAAGPEVAQDIEGAIVGKTVIDATNPLTPDYSGPALESTSGAEEFQRWLPGARVAKAFNTLFASRQATPSTDVDAFVAADDPVAKQETLALVESLGFAAVPRSWLGLDLGLEAGALSRGGLASQPRRPLRP